MDRVWALQDLVSEGETYSADMEAAFHRTIKKVSEDIEGLKFNTAIAAMMALLNDITAVGHLNKAEFRSFLIMLNPFAPHITEELWNLSGFEGMVCEQKWVSYDEEKCRENTVEIAVQVNGKIKSKLNLAADCDKETAVSMAKADEKVAAALEGKQIVKEIVVPNKLVNIVVK